MQKPVKTWLLVLAAGLILGLLIVVGILAWKYHQAAGNSTQAERDRVMREVGRLFELPTDEQPTVAQIKDQSQLSKEAFFERAKNGDYLIIYAKNKMALIYREKDNKLVNVGPINLGTTSRSPSPTPTAGH